MLWRQFPINFRIVILPKKLYHDCHSQQLFDGGSWSVHWGHADARPGTDDAGTIMMMMMMMMVMMMMKIMTMMTMSEGLMGVFPCPHTQFWITYQLPVHLYTEDTTQEKRWTLISMMITIERVLWWCAGPDDGCSGYAGYGETRSVALSNACLF